MSRKSLSKNELKEVLVKRQIQKARSGVTPLPALDLTNTDFPEGADLVGLDLSNTNFRGATLKGANFNAAQLKDACFWDADLTDADFTDATELLADQLAGADLTR